MKYPVVYGYGPRPSRIMFVGERPGFDESNVTGIPFTGPAGDELWDRCWRILNLDRDDVYTTNLVKTFSMDPPSKAEVARWGPELRTELLRVRPSIIVTVGYHAARFFLPQFEDVNGDYFHGLAFPFDYGRHRPRRAVVVPIVHSSAALRQPDRYQTQLSRDVEAVAAVASAATVSFHRVRRLVPYRVGLASFGKTGQILGVDSEFDSATGDVQAVTLSAEGRYACALEIADNTPPKFLRPALFSSRRIICHQAKAEWHSLRRLGIDLNDVGAPRVEDTMLKAYLLGLPRSLKILSYRLLGVEMEEYLDLVEPIDQQRVATALQSVLDAGETAGVSKRALSSVRRMIAKTDAQESLRKRWSKSTFAAIAPLPPVPTWRDVPEEHRLSYAMTDSIAHRRLDDLLDPMIDTLHLRQVYEIDRAVLPMLIRNEEVGLAVDVDGLKELETEFRRDYDRARQELDRIVGHPVNPHSGDQVSDVLFRELQIRPTKLTKSKKHHSTEDKYLKARRKDHAAVPLILESRQLLKYLSTYIEKLPSLLIEGRYHPDWMYANTATGRLAEVIILLIPKHSERAKRIRDCFYATAGHRLVSVDLSQIELRTMAHLSQDARLLEAFTNNEDVHAQVAHDLLGAPKRKDDQDESLHRLPAKTINFGIINGMTEFGMLDQLHEQGQLQWTIDDVRALLDDWFKVHVGVDRYWKEQIALARRQGYVVDLFGRRRWIAGVLSTSEQVRREAERQCLCPIQATADGISKIWNKKIWKRIILPRLRSKSNEYCEPWVRVHDDTTLETDKGIAEDTAKEMLALVPDLLCVPTLAEAKIGRHWGSLKKPKKS